MRQLCRLPCVVVLVGLAVVGCQRWNWRGEGYDPLTNSLTENVRPAADEKKFSGLDSRARDIERNLGVR